MLPVATQAHAIGGRARLRIPACKGDSAYFAAVEQALAAHDGVAYVAVNPLTGSVLIHHRTDLKTLLQYAQNQQLFTVEAAPEPPRQVLTAASRAVDTLDRALQHTTGGAVDLDEAMFIGLLGASIIQVLRGQALSPASTLLSYAAAILAVHRANRAQPR